VSKSKSNSNSSTPDVGFVAEKAAEAGNSEQRKSAPPAIPLPQERAMANKKSRKPEDPKSAPPTKIQRTSFSIDAEKNEYPSPFDASHPLVFLNLVETSPGRAKC
jgi:hypothetical protein